MRWLMRPGNCNASRLGINQEARTTLADGQLLYGFWRRKLHSPLHAASGTKGFGEISNFPWTLVGFKLLICFELERWVQVQNHSSKVRQPLLSR